MKYLSLLLLISCTLQASLGDSERPSVQPAFGTTRWAITLGIGDKEMIDAITFAPDGDVLVGGTWWSGDSPRGFLERRAASDGNREWQVLLDGAAPASAQVQAVATSGSSVIAVGSFMGTIDFGGQTLSTSTTTPGVTPATTHLFVASYAADGTLQWARAFDSTVAAYGLGVATSADTIYVAGWFRGVVDVGTGPVGQPTDWANQGDGLLLAYSHTGQRQWGRTFLGGSSVRDVLVMPGGDVLVTGHTLSGTSYGGAPMTDRGVLLARFGGADGTHRMSRVVAGEDVPMGLALASDGNVIVTRHRGAASPTYVEANVRSLVDTNGDPLWTAATERVGAGRPAATASGFVLGGTVTQPAPDLGSGPLGRHVLYLAAYDLAGAIVDLRTYGNATNGQQDLSLVASAPSGELAFTALFAEPIDFGLGPIAPVADRSAAVVLLDAP